MADLAKYVAAGEKVLSASIATTATTVVLVDINSRDGTALTMTDFGTTGQCTLDPGGSNMELISFTGISSTSLTGVTRGLGFEAPYTTVTALKKAHTAGTKLVFSNPPQLYDSFANKDNDETITGTWTFPSAAIAVYDSAPTFSTDEEIITKKYADDLAIAGAPDSNATTKGLLELATDAELASGAAAGSGDTTAGLAATSSSFNATAAASKVPVAEATGKLGEDWIGLTTAGDLVQSDGTDLQRLAVTANQYVKGNAGGTAVEYGGANLDEASTAFGLTDITGTEMETLSDGSNADTLHVHDFLKEAEDKLISSGTGGFVILQNAITDLAASSALFELDLNATGAAAQKANAIVCTVPASGDDVIILTDQAVADVDGTTSRFDDFDRLEVVGSFSLSANTNTRVSFGIMESGLTAAPQQTGSSKDGAWFHWAEDGTLYAAQFSLATNENTSIAGITASDSNVYRIVVDKIATTTKFYVNGTLEATLTDASAQPNTATAPRSLFAMTAVGASTETVTLFTPLYMMYKFD